MAHRFTRDTRIFPRMNRDIARHNIRLREAIRKNLSEIVAREDIITADRNKIIRVPIRQLKEWRFATDADYSKIIGHGDGKRKVKCPSCQGRGCEYCNGIGLTTRQKSWQIKRFIRLLEHGPFAAAAAAMLESAPDEIDVTMQISSDDYEERLRKGKSGRPRSLTGDRVQRWKPGGGSGSGASGDGEGDGDGGREGGDTPGMEQYETDISIAELEQLIFNELELPNLEEKGSRKILTDHYRFDDIRKVGPMSALEKRQTVKNNIKRNAKETGQAKFQNVEREDLRFRRWKVDENEEACAVVMALMDVSGSMGEDKKFLARSFFMWMKRFLESQYDAVEIVFIAHHTEAKEVSEDDFFHRVESGGTHMSSAWILAEEILKDRYPSDSWNAYIYHFSDGWNFGNDNDAFMKSVQNCLDYPVSMAGYGEIGEKPNQSGYSWWAAPTAIYKGVEETFGSDPHFSICRITDQKDVWPALKNFFSKDLKTQLPAEKKVGA